RLLLGGLDARGIALEFGDAVLGRARQAFVASSVEQNGEAIAVFMDFDVSFLAHHHAGLAVLFAGDEHVLHAPVVHIGAFDEEHAFGIGRFAEYAGRDARHLVAAFDLPTIFVGSI